MTALAVRIAPDPSPPGPKLRWLRGQQVDSDNATTVRGGIPLRRSLTCSLSLSLSFAPAPGGVRNPNPTGLPGHLYAMPRAGDVKRRCAPSSPLAKPPLASRPPRCRDRAARSGKRLRPALSFRVSAGSLIVTANQTVLASPPACTVPNPPVARSPFQEPSHEIRPPRSHHS